jgi:hypothetical protein
VPAVEPVPGDPVALADTGGERVLCLADYHAGLEVALRAEGVEVRSRADDRRERLLDLLAATDADRVVVVGDLGNAIGSPSGPERTEIDDLLAALTARVPVTVTKGNHDGDLDRLVAELGHDGGVSVTDGPGTRLGEVGFAHGHTWPARAPLEADVLCVAHEHPVVRLTDEVGGSRQERAWLRGRLAPGPFRDRFRRQADAGAGEGDAPRIDGELVVFPAFNELLGGTWVNVDGDFLSPFLPDGLADGEAYLLDGTRLGDYRSV